MRWPGQRVERKRDGTFVLHLPEAERELLRSLGDQLRSLLNDGTDPGLRRLTPPAYVDDADAQGEYQRLTADDLARGRLHNVEVLEAALDARRLTEDQLVAMMGSINDIRLVIGTNIDVSEETTIDDFADDDPHRSVYAVYTYLSLMLEQIIDQLE